VHYVRLVPPPHALVPLTGSARPRIGALVERPTRYVKLLHLPAFNSIGVHAALIRALGELPPRLRRALTWDRATEMAKHLDVTADFGTRIYFRNAASPL
jgi:IS30 family transposase